MKQSPKVIGSMAVAYMTVYHVSEPGGTGQVEDAYIDQAREEINY